MSILKVENLVKRYGQILAVNGVSLSIKSGQIYGLLGPNGAGKTTTISMICGLLKADQGVIEIDGVSLADQPSRARRSFGVVPQEIALYEDLSGYENLVFWGRLADLSRGEARTRAKDMLDQLSLTERGKDKVKTYSGGMKRRINIGCALLHQPKLLMLDEPTVGIDPQARNNIVELVRDIANKGTAILYTTHYLEEAETLCDLIGIIDHGTLHAEGSLETLRDRLGSQQLFILEGQFEEADPTSWETFQSQYHLLQKQPNQWMVSARTECHPADAIRDLLELPLDIENVILKKPNLNDVFLHLTGRALRE